MTSARTPKMINEPVICLVCDYPLCGLSPAGRCPECGTAIIESLGGRPLSTTPAEWLRHVALGMSLILHAYALGPLLMLANGVLTVFATNAPVFGRDGEATLMMWCAGHALMAIPTDYLSGQSELQRRGFAAPTDRALPVLAVVLAGGCWLATLGHPSMVPNRSSAILSSVIRGLSIMQIVLPLGLSTVPSLRNLSLLLLPASSQALVVCLLSYFTPVAASLDRPRLLSWIRRLTLATAGWFVAVFPAFVLIRMVLISKAAVLAAYCGTMVVAWLVIWRIQRVLTVEIVRRKRIAHQANLGLVDP